MQLSQGPYSYNRFDMYEGKGASNPEKMEKKVKEAGKKNKLRGGYLRDEDKKEEEKEEEGTAGEGGDGGGVSEEVVAENRMAAMTAGQSEGKNMMSGSGPAKVTGGKAYTMKGKDGKPLFKEEEQQLNTPEIEATGMEPRMAMYSRALGRMGALYDPLQEAEVAEAAKPDYLDFDKDGDKKEPMKKALKEKGSVKKEEVEITKDMVLQYLIDEDFVNNEVSAEAMFNHITDGFLANIEEMMTNDILSEGANKQD